MSARRRFGAVVCTLAGIMAAAGSAAIQLDAQGSHDLNPVLITSPLPPSTRPLHNPKEKPLGRPHGKAQSGNLVDPVVQTSASTPAAAPVLGQWEGLGVGLAGFTPTGR